MHITIDLVSRDTICLTADAAVTRDTICLTADAAVTRDTICLTADPFATKDTIHLTADYPHKSPFTSLLTLYLLRSTVLQTADPYTDGLVLTYAACG